MLITTNILGRHRLFTDPTYARIAIDSLYLTQERYPFFLFAFVIMPDHCHFLVRAPERQRISKILYTFKRSVAFEIDRGPLWQKRFHIRMINNPLEAMSYIHLNPVRAKLCDTPEDYPWSSANGRWDVSDVEWFHGIDG